MIVTVSAEVQRILESVLKLTDTEQAQVLAVLVDSLDHCEAEEDVESAWIAEARQRLADIRAGRSPLTRADDLFGRGRAMIEDAKRQRAAG